MLKNVEHDRVYMNNRAITVESIHKSYRQAEADVHVLRGIDATFIQGHTYAITGSSGSGKSTLLHILAGFETPDAGAVYVNGKNLLTISCNERTDLSESFFGVVFQQPYLIKELSVIENIMLKGLIAGHSSSICKEQAMDLLKTVGLEDKAEVMPATLSGGQQQRVAILRALCKKPSFLLADEPTGSLDAKTGIDLIELLLDCQQEWGMGLVICSHDEQVITCMQHVLHIEQGKIKEFDK